MARQNLTEVGATVTPLTEAGKKPRLKIQLITPGWGSSGYYSTEVLKAAAEAKAWPAGTHMYLDHIAADEVENRPERSVRDIAARLTEDAYWDERVGAVIAEAVPVGAGKDFATDKEFLEAVGVSVSVVAEVNQGEVEGRKGYIISEIFADTFNSVDFVTHAGRGGKVLQLVESARRGHVAEATSSDRYEQLAYAVKSAHGADDTWCYVRDYDPDSSKVWFAVTSEDEPTRTYEQTYTVADDDLSVALTGDQVEVRVRTEYVPVTSTASETAAPTNVPVDPAGLSKSTQESQEDTMPMHEVEETRLRQLESDAGRVQLLETERDTARTELAEARKELAVEKAKSYAREFAATRIETANSELA
ncbi:hypothetical protein, partial [Kribbella deserti]